MRASAVEHGCTVNRAWHAADGSCAFSEAWRIEAEPGETATVLEGDVGLVPLGGVSPVGAGAPATAFQRGLRPMPPRGRALRALGGRV